MNTATAPELNPLPATHVPSPTADRPINHPSIQVRHTTTLPREGRYWLLACAGLWLTGWLKGINLILLLAYLLVLFWVLNWWIARRALRGTFVRRVVRGPIFAGTPIVWEVQASVASRPVTGWAVVDEGPRHTLRWSLLNTPAGDNLRLRGDVTLSQRGEYGCPPVRAVSSFPFGLVRQEVAFGAGDQFTVLPRLGTLHAGRLRRWLMHAARPDERARHTRRRLALEAEFHGLRQFRPGDSPRWIHWRTSARTGELVVREFDHGTHHDLLLIVEPYAPAPDSNSVDAAVNLAATICWTWSEEAGDRVALAVLGPEPVVVPGGDGPRAVMAALNALAAVRGTTVTDAQTVGRRLHRTPLLSGPALLVSTRPDTETADELSRILDRPVASMDATAPPSFYQPPA
ncbi:MAG TPA: DUF58 domain-containing protein [Gemmataceae bacterium]|jgi:uncharacterized protein (DUF58 family)